MTSPALLLYLHLATSESALQTALARAESAQPVNPQLLDHALVGLAQFLQERGRYHEAEPLYVRSLNLNQSTYGPASPEAALGLLHLGTLYHAEFRLDQAETLLRQASTLFQPDSLDYTYSIANLASVLADQGENARAEPVLRRALYLIQKLVPENDPVIPALQANLGLVYIRQGEFRKARPLLQASLETYEVRNDPARASAHAALAELAIGEKRWLDASAQIDQAFKLTIQLHSGDHPRLIGILHMRAIVEVNCGDTRSAISDMKRSLELLEALAGPATSTLPPLLDDYAALLGKAKLRNEAKSVRLRARTIRQQVSRR